jgi:hypothetical protein
MDADNIIKAGGWHVGYDNARAWQILFKVYAAGDCQTYKNTVD